MAVEEKVEMSTWNSSQLYVLRLDNIMKQLFISRFERDFVAWYNALEGYAAELYPVMTKKEIAETEEIIKPLTSIEAVASTLRDKRSLYNYKQFLVKLELHLRKVMNSHGLLISKESDPAKAFNK